MLAQITKIALLFVLSFTSVRLYGSVVDWSSPDGISRLEKSQYKNDFFKLASQFESQHNKVYCGIATTTIVMNYPAASCGVSIWGGNFLYFG